MEAILKTLYRFIVRRRGDCFGAVAAGFVFMMAAPGSEDPTAMRMLGIPLMTVGSLLSIIAVSGKGLRKETT